MSNLDLAMWGLGWSCIAAGATVAAATFRDAARQRHRILPGMLGQPVPPRASGAPTHRAPRTAPRRIVEADAALTLGADRVR